jgi:two-component system CheB/CheR fusion protein
MAASAPDDSTRVVTGKRAGGALGFPIVGIGASAGGLEAFEGFFRACPADTGMGFVLVPHLDPDHVSLLTEILQRSTTMPVLEALDRVAVAPNHVYIIPPNREMGILDGELQVHLPEQPRGQRMPIDGFLRALAKDQAERAIGIVLSGTATDGTLGLRAILGAGGVCLVQDPASARYDGMPQSAIAAGYATHILPVDAMPAMLQQLTRQSAYRLSLPSVQAEQTISGINQILLQLRSATGHDFSLYKKSTIGRRIERRMVQHDIDDLAVYARFLKENPAEIQALFKELLINVTSFFRDPEAFEALKHNILPPMLAAKQAGSVVRVWVAGCASGEEAYSIAMVLQELLDEHKSAPAPTWDFQIFATDIDDDAIATARAGRYPPNIAQDVTPERLRQFFVKDADERAGFKVKKALREKVVFAVHSVIKDPPFTRLDLLSCRNLLIYLQGEQQDRLMPGFHYALNAGGVLFLSTSESINNHRSCLPRSTASGSSTAPRPVPRAASASSATS